MSVSAEEVAKHNKDGDDSDCWVIVGDQVLDVTAFLSEHPGGRKSIMMFAGKDATEEFDMLHDRKVQRSASKLAEGSNGCHGSSHPPLIVCRQVIKKYGLDEAFVGAQCAHVLATRKDSAVGAEGTVVLKGTIKK
ncbi:NITA [Symbiodinium sp. CCMP2592]|nr:NITA [Symbiodinium sp. CCMP2592]